MTHAVERSFQDGDSRAGFRLRLVPASCSCEGRDVQTVDETRLEPPSTTVLVVEDDDEIRELVCDLLVGEGYLALPASNGRVALEAMERAVPDLVLLDLMMPVMNGWQLLDEMKRRPQLEPVPVVVVSALDQQPNGVVGQIRKPFDLDALLAMVERSHRRA